MLQTQLAYVIFSAFGDLRLVDEKDGSGAGDALSFRAGFSTPLGRSLPYSLALERDQFSVARPLRSLSREVFFSDASLGGVARAVI